MSATTDRWVSTVTPVEMAALMRAARSAVILTHAKPDGDAIGSTVAVARCLQRLGVRVQAWYVGPLPRWTDELAAGVDTRELRPGAPVASVNGAALMTEPDAVIIADTGSWPQLAEVRSFIEPRRDRVLLIDHHLHGDAIISDRRLLEPSAASCTQVLAPVCAALLDAAGGGTGAAGVSPARFPTDVADALYLGLATDTGWFRYSNTGPATLRLAGDLLEAGVDHTRLYRIIEQQDHAARWTLFGRALRSLEIHAGGRIATMMLTLKDFEDTGATPNDTSGFADMLLTVASVQLSAVLVESSGMDGPLTKISLRSKPGPEAIDVNQLAAKLGGGGHARAAGAKLKEPLTGAVRTLVDAAR